MYNIIPLILILISLTIIITTVFRKFSVLANLDIESIQAEREAKFKEQIIGNRIKRNFFKYYSKIARIVQPAGRTIGNFFRLLYDKLVEFKENYNREDVGAADKHQAINKLFSEAEELLRKEEYEQAEKKFIDIISADSKSIKAFRCLGRLYIDRKNYNEARQTLEHALKLTEQEYIIHSTAPQDQDGEDKEDLSKINSQIAELYFDLSTICQATENYKEALKILKKSLKIEPNNPRYLDTKLEISIMNKDKFSALDTYEKLEKVNPDNKKLAEFKKLIDRI